MGKVIKKNYFGHDAYYTNNKLVEEDKKIDKAKNKQVTKLSNRQVTKLSNSKFNKKINISSNFKFNEISKKLSSRVVFSKETTPKKHDDNWSPQHLEDKKLQKLYAKSFKVTNTKDAFKLMSDFIDTLSQSYSEEKMPSTQERKDLYHAYTDICQHYLRLTNLDEKKLSTKLTFTNLIQMLDENKTSLKKNLENTAFLSAASQSFSGRKAIKEKDSKLIYENFLGMYFSPSPMIHKKELHKKMDKTFEKGFDISDESLASMAKLDNEINKTSDTIAYIKKEGLFTQEDFIKDIYNGFIVQLEATLAKKIIQHIKIGKLQNKDINYITDSILKEYQDGLPENKNSKKNDLKHIRRIIEKEVIIALSNNDFEQPLKEKYV